jgi:hypothetical protein
VTLRSMWVLTGSNSRHNRVAYFGRSNTAAVVAPTAKPMAYTEVDDKDTY